MKKVLTIAGSDSSGGAGIQADLKTITAHKMYGMSAITALTAQNTLGVDDIMEASPAFVGAQLDSIFKDIRPDAIKIGMVASVEIMVEIASKLKEYGAHPVVLDPVMVSTSGCQLISNDAKSSLMSTLMPLSDVITPNIPEAEVLSQMSIHNDQDMIQAAQKIGERYSGAILIKGGHAINEANDLLYANHQVTWIKGQRIDTSNTHGTGCTLSSAIACELANGEPLETAIRKAKAYLTGALADGLDLGQGSGPLNHMWDL